MVICSFKSRNHGTDVAEYMIFFLCLTPFDARNSWFHQSSKIALTWENSKYTAKKIMANFSRSCFYWLAGKCTKCNSSILVFPSINRAVGSRNRCEGDFGRSVNPIPINGTHYLINMRHGSWTLLQTVWLWNHTSQAKFDFNEFVANALRDDMGMNIFDHWGCGIC